jgi:hypothetical protein
MPFGAAINAQSKRRIAMDIKTLKERMDTQAENIESESAGEPLFLDDLFTHHRSGSVYAVIGLHQTAVGTRIKRTVELEFVDE